MIDQFVALCFRKRLVVRLIAIFACIFGIYAWSQLAIDAYPLLSPVSAQVTTQVPGLAAEEVEQQITIPLERALNGTPGPDQHALDQHVRAVADQPSVSRRRRGLLGAPARAASASATSPCRPGRPPGSTPVSAPELEIYRYTLESDTKNLMELSEISALGHPAGAAAGAGRRRSRQFRRASPASSRLDLDPTELLRYGLGINDVINAINNNTANAGGGRVSARRPELHRPRRRPGAYARRPRQRGRDADATACRSWSAISAP